MKRLSESAPEPTGYQRGAESCQVSLRFLTFQPAHGILGSANELMKIVTADRAPLQAGATIPP
jgi:hypothetical protein